MDNRYPDLDEGPTQNWFLANFYNEQYQTEIQPGFGKRPYEELYDLERDPDEITNVAEEPAYSDIKRQLADLLDKVLTESNDPRMQPGPCPFEKLPFTASYSQTRQ